MDLCMYTMDELLYAVQELHDKRAEQLDAGEEEIERLKKKVDDVWQYKTELQISGTAMDVKIKELQAQLDREQNNSLCFRNKIVDLEREKKSLKAQTYADAELMEDYRRENLNLKMRISELEVDKMSLESELADVDDSDDSLVEHEEVVKELLTSMKDALEAYESWAIAYYGDAYFDENGKCRNAEYSSDGR